MITLLRKVAHCSHLLRTSSFCFAQTSNIQFHKAVLASKIIQAIDQSPFNDYRSSSFPSLNESILEIIDKYESNKIDGLEKNVVEQAAKEVRNCFDSGVYIPIYMCDQSRNLETKKSYEEIKSQNGKIQILNIKEIPQDQLLMFIKLTFCPTYVITGQIFRRILKPQRYRFIIGQQGVGKKYSSILYTLLSEMIFRYRHQYCSGDDDLPSEINFKIPKAIYIKQIQSQNLDQNIYLEKIKQILKQHFYQFMSSELAKEENVLKLSLGLDDKYLKRFEVSTIFLSDKMNFIAAAYRQQEFATKLFEELRNRLRIKQQKVNVLNVVEILKLEQQILQMRTLKADAALKISKANKFLKVLSNIIGLNIFGSHFYPSSVDIESNLLDSLKLMGESKQYRISALKRRLQYPISLHSNIAISDTCEMIALNLKSYWLKLQESNNLSGGHKYLLQKIKTLLSQVMRKQQFFFILPLKITQFMKGYTEQQRNNLQRSSQAQGKGQRQKILEGLLKLQELSYKNLESISQTQLEHKLYQLIRTLQQQSIQEMIFQFSEFLNKKTGKQKINNLKLQLGFRLWK